jgi:hypothetical protein
MILTPHAIVGSVITNLLPNNPALGFALAYASHYALDVIPHLDYDISGFIDEDNKTVRSVFHNVAATVKSLSIIAIDFSVALTLCAFIFIHDDKTMYLTMSGAAAGMLPDFLQFVYLQFKKYPWTTFQWIHDYFHNPDRMKDNRAMGTLTQIVTPSIILFFYFLLK